MQKQAPIHGAYKEFCTILQLQTPKCNFNGASKLNGAHQSF